MAATTPTATASANLRSRYLSLSSERASLQPAIAAHSSATSRARHLTKDVTLAQTAAAKSARRAEAAAAAVTRFQTSAAVKARYVCRRDARRAAEEHLATRRDATDADARGAAERRDGLRATLDAVQSKADATKAAAERDGAAHKEMRAILNEAFEGEGRGSEEENEAERALENERAERASAVDVYAVNARAAGMVDKGLMLLLQALRDLRTARNAKNADLFLGGGFGFAAGATTQYKLRAAGELAAKAEKYIAEAKEVQPGLPLRDVSVGVKGGLLLGGLDLAFDNVFSDFYVRQQVQKSYRAVEKAVHEVSNAKEWVDGQAAAWKAHLIAKTASEKEAEVRLYTIRDSLIRSDVHVVA